MSGITTPEGLFAAARSRDAASPLVTFYDDASGERMELSAASLGNWIAKTHFLITDELGFGTGAKAYVSLPLHWLDLVVAFGAWSAGLEIVSEPDGADVAFVAEDGVRGAAAAGEVYALALAQWGQGFAGAPPAGSADFVAAVRPQADAWGSVRSPSGPDDPALDGVSRRDLVASTTGRASELGLTDGARLLVGESPSGAIDLRTLLAPFVVGGSLVLLRHAEADAGDRRATQENVTHVAGS